MNARSMTRTATLVAMTLTLTAMATSVDAAPRGRMGGRTSNPKDVTCRTITSYQMSVWVAPLAIVVTSPEAWSQWNREQVDAGRAVAEEALPQGVDWTKEVVVILALGELVEPHHVELRGANKNANATELDLHVEPGRGGRCPALVVALDRGCRNIKLLADYTLTGVPTQPGTYGSLTQPGAYGVASSHSSISGTSGAGDGLTVVTSWGKIKADYR